jgi:putative acetyltransferase
MIIRQAREEDFTNIRVFVAQAFATARARNGDEPAFVDRMRASADFLPELALVAEETGGIIGFVMLTRTAIVDGQARHAALLLAPLAEALPHRNQGLGARLVREAFARARDLGHALVLLVGDPGYYRRFGFIPAAGCGIRHHDTAIAADRVLVCALTPAALAGVRGQVESF